MRTRMHIIIVTAVLLATAGAWAQTEPCAQAGEKGSRCFDPQTVTTIRGTVVDTGGLGAALGLSGMIEIRVRTEQETLPVQLAPREYLDTQNTKVEQDDRVEVTGSRIIADNRPMIIAMEVRKGDQVLKLRDKQGHPLWLPPKKATGPQAGATAAP